MKNFLSTVLSFLINLASAFGFLWLIVEIVSYFGNEQLSNSIKKYWWLFGIIGLLYAIFKLIPKLKYSFKVPNRDANIFIRKKNILKIKGSLIVTINNQFQINQDGNLLQSNSILSQVVKKHYNSEPLLLQKAINKELESNFYLDYKKKKTNEYKIGTVVPITINNKKFYFLSNTKLNEQNKSYCNDKMFEKSLNELWVYLSDCASKEHFVIPLIGTGNGRLGTDRYIVFKEILLSFLSSLSSKNYAESLTICFHPADIKKHKIDFSKIGDFSLAKIKYQEYSSKSSKGTNEM